MLGGLIAFNLIDAGKPKASVEQCFSKEDVMKYIDDNKFQTLTQSVTPDGKTLEILFTPLNNQETIIIRHGHGKYCLMSKTNKTKQTNQIK